LIPIQQSWEQQQQFVADASHELRTPLTIIQTHSELLLRRPDRSIEQESKWVSTILQEATRMSKLVGHLLTLARSDSNQLEIERRPLRLDQVLLKVVRQLEPLVKMKEIMLRVDIDGPIDWQADEERLHQLFVILLVTPFRDSPFLT